MATPAAALAALLVASATVWGQAPAPAGPPAPVVPPAAAGGDSPAPPPLQDTPSQLPRLFFDNTKAVLLAPGDWDSEDWTRFGLASAAVLGTALILDKPVHEAVLRHRGATWDEDVKTLEPIGSKYSVGTAAAFYLTGWIGGLDGARATGADALSASLASGLLVATVKYAVGRARPNQGYGPNHFAPFGGYESFPSGHTTEGFTVASVIASHYPEAWVQVTCYGLATLGGLARVGQDVHWTSDVLAGALIGTTIGRAVTRMNQQARGSARGQWQVSLAPDLRPGYQGLQVGLAF